MSEIDELIGAASENEADKKLFYELRDNMQNPYGDWRVPLRSFLRMIEPELRSGGRKSLRDYFNTRHFLMKLAHDSLSRDEIVTAFEFSASVLMPDDMYAEARRLLTDFGEFQNLMSDEE